MHRPSVGGGHGRDTGTVLVTLAVVLLCAVGVSAIQEESKTFQEHNQQEKASTARPAEPAVVEDGSSKANLGFIHAFVASFSVIIVSELGDKTFFIAAIMAMRYNRLTVLTGAILALAIMTCLSVLFGYAATIIPRIYTYYVSTALFAIFGVRMLREGLKMSPDEGQEELEEVQAEIKKKDEELQRSKLANGTADLEAGTGITLPQTKWYSLCSPIFIQAFTLSFLAEWGDRSQLTTIILAAREVRTLRMEISTSVEAVILKESCFSEPVWSCSGWHSGTLFVHWAGCDRRQNDCPENISQNSYDHWRDCLSGLCHLGSVHQARNWIVAWDEGLSFSLHGRSFSPEGLFDPQMSEDSGTDWHQISL
uniref:GDT1 family protein n=1 Tax=Oryzias latipes TaxID=8090 RepID=A0A3P9HPN7_ORYLA